MVRGGGGKEEEKRKGERRVHVPGDEMLLMGRPIMEEPETVAVPLPKCKVRSGRVALQGTSLGVGGGGG